MAKHPYSEVAAEVVRIIDGGSLGIPRGHGANLAFKDLARRLNFDSTSDLSNLFSAFTNLCIYGDLDRAVPAAHALRGIPNGTPMVMYGYINSCITQACYFSDRAGDTASTHALRELATNAPGKAYQPMPRALDGSMLKNLFADPAADHDLRVGEALSDIARLATMWVFGSPNPDWTPAAITAAIDANIAGVLGLKKWQPWR